jgi:hypothetical protein
MPVNVQSAILSLSEEHGGSLSVVIDSKQYTMRNDNPLFGQAVEAYRKEDWDSLMTFLSPEKAVRQYLFEYDDIKVENGAVYFGGSAVHSLCVDRILQFCDSGFSPMPLVKFLSKLQKNPSRRSVEELYRFLERNNLTVTTNGNFLAYKAVTSDFYSITAGNAQLLKGKDDGKGRIFNGVGEEIQVYRNYVDDDANRGCSVGLHAGTLEYAQTFGGSSATLVIVEIDPADVVSVPHDCECQKLRTARYKVVDICTQRLDLPVYDSRFSTENDEDDWDDDDCCEDCECEECECDWEDESEEEDDFLEQEVEVKSLIKWLYQHDYDELAFELSKKFAGKDTVVWQDVYETENDIEFLWSIAQEL